MCASIRVSRYCCPVFKSNGHREKKFRRECHLQSRNRLLDLCSIAARTTYLSGCRTSEAQGHGNFTWAFSKDKLGKFTQHLLFQSTAKLKSHLKCYKCVVNKMRGRGDLCYSLMLVISRLLVA